MTLRLNFGENNIKRNTFWKFNSSLLRDKTYLNEVNEEINKIILEYAVSPYDRDSLLHMPTSDIEFIISEDLLLDFMLIRSKTISYSTMKKKKENEKERQLEGEIDILEKRDNINENDRVILNEKKEELKNLREKRMEGVLLRSKARWIAEGEKNSSYFCNLEKRHFVSKTMTKLKGNNGEEVTEANKLVESVKNFYEKLYERRSVEECDINKMVQRLPCLSEEEANKCEGEIKYEEACCVLKKMKN